MAESAGCNLFDRGAAAREPLRVVFRSQIPYQRRNTIVGSKQRQYSFKECSLARAWAGDQAYRQYSFVAETFAQRTSDHIVLL
jgi:hypothetical protein